MMLELAIAAFTSTANPMGIVAGAACVVKRDRHEQPATGGDPG